jgi:hypothetical protein
MHARRAREHDRHGALPNGLEQHSRSLCTRAGMRTQPGGLVGFARADNLEAAPLTRMPARPSSTHSLSAAASRFRTFRLPPVSGSSIPGTREFALAACRRRTTFDTTWHYLIPASTPFCWSGRDCWPPTCATRDESKPRQVPDRRSASHALALAHRTRNIPRCQLHDWIQLASSPCTPSR